MTSSPNARRPWRPRRVAITVAVLLGPFAVTPAHAQFDLGGQRAGTSSGTFLKIGVGARAESMGEAFVAVANDPSTIYWNPAGLGALLRGELQVSHVSWPAQINYEHVTWVVPSQKLGGSLALQFGVLSTQLDETTSLQPFGTGRTFTYSDVVVGGAYARRWTDKLLVGFGAKYLREDLGSSIGGPTTSSVMFDIGSIYYLGLGSVRIATSLTNFGSELRPSGDYVSPYTGEVRTYDGFDPPLMFRYGFAFEPLENTQQRLTTSFEIAQPADNSQMIKAGAEWTWNQRLSLRSGYNFNADALKFSAGAGLFAPFGPHRATVDYAYTDGGHLGAVHRLSLGYRF
jgi:hypothetical protein